MVLSFFIIVFEVNGPRKKVIEFVILESNNSAQTKICPYLKRKLHFIYDFSKLFTYLIVIYFGMVLCQNNLTITVVMFPFLRILLYTYISRSKML